MPVSRPQQKIALVTGAARRIGRALAVDLAQHGWSIALHCRDSNADAERVAAEIKSAGGTAAVFCADLVSCPAIDKLVADCSATLGPPTCLINNASEFLPDHISSLDEALWDKHLDINLKAPVFLSRAMVRHLPADAVGNIINIIDQRVWKLTPEFFSYTISKAGLWTATQTLAQSLAPRVRVNAIGPGPVLRSIHQSDADFEAEKSSTLLKTGPSTDEIAAAVRFILSTPSMTGQMIALDSGQHLT